MLRSKHANTMPKRWLKNCQKEDAQKSAYPGSIIVLVTTTTITTIIIIIITIIIIF
jgi:hypothetical protein